MTELFSCTISFYLFLESLNEKSLQVMNMSITDIKIYSISETQSQTIIKVFHGPDTYCTP